MSDSSGVAVIVITKLDDHVAAINTALRDAGHPARCAKIEKPSDLQAALEASEPELIVLFGQPEAPALRPVTEARDNAAPNTPLLLVAAEITESTIAAAMDFGASDAVSLSNIARFQSVATRELQAYRDRNSLNSVMSSANQYRQELQSLKDVSVEAIADIQEGIVVNANPAWLELFGFGEQEDLTGHPVMDLCAENDRQTLKGGLVACQKNKWDESKLKVNGIQNDGEEFAVEFSLELVEFDDEPAVRMLVAPTIEADSTPVSMVEQALQRDHVTGFFNRQHFTSVATERLGNPPSGGVRAMVYIRPDRFSKARDDIGLMGTDSVISHLAQLLQDFTQPTDIYGRFGGTMFTIMLERGNMSDVEAWTEQLLQTIAEAVFEHDDRSTTITCSLGLCEVDSKATDIVRLLADAERACRGARQQGGNKIQLSESSGAAKKIRQDDSVWVPRIRGALMENRLRLEHQPIGSLNSDIEGAFDTLVRMLDEEGNTILPSEFMPVAERTGLSKNIDRWVTGASLSFCGKTNAQLVFIRLSRDSLLDETLVDWLQGQAKQAGIPPHKICFEIDELIVNKRLRQTQVLAEKLRGAGFLFAVEHFGKGDNSAQTIAKVPMDYVKIDGSLMQGLHKNTSSQQSVKELARQAADSGIKTIAERVQDANTMAVLWQLGISYIQGNYVQSTEIVIEDTSQSSVTTRALAVDQPDTEKAAEV